jgi:methylmalonyl-CoA mutase cobalamin-binding subunit
MGASGGVEVIDLGFVSTPASAITKFRFLVQSAGDRIVTQATSAGSKVLGVAQHDVSAGDATLGAHVNVRLMGISVVEAGAAIAVGDFVTTDTSGRAAAVSVAVGLKEVAGIALQAAAGAGDLVTILLIPAGSRNTAVS